jgi:AcrR family transcriptional regulator
MESASPKDAPSAAASGKREQTKLLNRQLILEAARRVFSELGYSATTVRDIIRATPLATGTFYNYFKSKDEAFHAIRSEVALAIRPRLREERAKATTMEEFVAGSFRVFFEYAADERVGFSNARDPTDGTRLRMDTPEVIAGFNELREDIEAAIAKGLFAPLDADYLTAAFVGVAFEMAGHMRARRPVDPKAAADFATALFLGGLRALPKNAG